MKLNLSFLASIASLLFSLPSAAQPLSLQPGQYQVSAITSAGSAGGEKPETAVRCIRSEDLTNPESVFNNRFMANFKPDATCTVNGLALGAGKVSYSTDCKYSNVQVQGTLTSSSFSVERKATPKGGRGLVVETKLSGKRTGACT
jgi:hypothetical protein